MQETALPAVTAAVEDALVSGRIPGALVLVSADGKIVHREARGFLDTTSRYPLSDGTVMWLASLTKPACAAVLMMLADEGKLGIGDPVSRYIPEFSGAARVRVLPPGTPAPPPSPPFGPPPDPLPVYGEIPAEREILLRDLLTHTSGLQSIFRWNPDYRLPGPGETLAGHVPGLARVVRDFQPGSEWAYSNAAGFDILARVTEIASGLAFDELVRTRLSQPLGLRDFGFGRGAAARAAPLDPALAGTAVPAGETYHSGAAGLWSSAADYLTFAGLLRDGRSPRGEQLISADAVRQMTSNQVGDLCPGLNGRAATSGIGFGFGVAVVIDAAAAGLAVPAGAIGWDGMVTKRFWLDPATGISLFMYAPDQAVQQDIETAVYTTLS
jgi:CubicO group peptidase (beta-lactamase class C family)